MELISIEFSIAQVKVEIRQESIWVGREKENQYEIENKKQEESKSEKEPLELSMKQKTEIALECINKGIKPVIREKIDLIKQYGKDIAKLFGFSFSSNVNLEYTEFKEIHQKETKKSEETQDEADSDNPEAETNETIPENLKPKPPVFIEKVYKSPFSNEPTDLQETKTMSKQTYNSVMSCTDSNSTTKACTPEEWLNPKSPFQRTEESKKLEDDYVLRSRFIITFNKDTHTLEDVDPKKEEEP